MKTLFWSSIQFWHFITICVNSEILTTQRMQYRKTSYGKTPSSTKISSNALTGVIQQRRIPVTIPREKCTSSSRTRRRNRKRPGNVQRLQQQRFLLAWKVLTLEWPLERAVLLRGKLTLPVVISSRSLSFLLLLESC